MNDLIPTQEEVKAIELMAKHAVESKYVEKLGGYAGVFSIAMYARELGVPVMSALFGGMANIMGKITIAPQLMNALIRKRGHKLKIDSNDARCIIEGTRKDTGETCTVSFSVEDARKAGLYKDNGGWAKYPSDMCFARALSRLARRLFPDVIGMAYVEEEIGQDEERDEKQEESDITVNVAPTSSLYDLMVTFNEKFKSIENMDYDLDDFVKHSAEKYKKTANLVMEQAMKQPDKFSKSYLGWAEEKVASETKPLEQVDLLDKVV
jgi:hypothetical protein